jgi:hypothetical protein
MGAIYAGFHAFWNDGFGSLVYDADMPTSEIPLKAKRFQEIVLGMIVGLLLALCLAWAVYPKIYLHYHPGLPWPVIPQRWVEYSDSSPALVYFFLACMTAAFGLWQTRFSRRLGRDSSKLLTWLYLLFSLVFVVGSWTFNLGSHFWTFPILNDLYQADRVLEIGRIFIKWGLYASLAAAFLNVTYSSFRERRG